MYDDNMHSERIN